MAPNTDPQGAPLERVESFQYPSGHLGHLSQSQQGALENFKQLCEQKGYYRPAQDRQHPATHDDETLLRYLRARKFVPQDAFGQFKDTEDWRKTNQIEALYENIDLTEYMETAKLYPQWTGRRDKRGIPVYVFEVAGLTAKKMSEYEKKVVASGSQSHAKGGVDPKLIRLFALYENLTRFALPFCAALPDRPYQETPVSQSNNIVDISNVGLKQFWNLKDHMQLASTLATAHYPETLDRIFIIGAPSFFPTVWGWVKRWFDPITVSKIFILGQREMTSTLQRYIDVENIPKKYGGSLNWEWGCPPSLDKSAQNALKWQQPAKDAQGRDTFPPGPIKWRKDQNGDMLAMAVGSGHGRRRNDHVATLLAHDRELNLATVLTQDYGPASTTGEHTHPNEHDTHFPSSGQTPPDDDGPRLDPRVGRREEEIPTHAAATKVLPNREIGHSTHTNHGPRDGTSTTRYVQQHDTHAQGQMAHGTPATIHGAYGDKTSTVEPSTVGQARKDVSVQHPEPEVDNSYLGQAEAAAGQVYNTAASAATSVLGMVGLGGKEEQPAQSSADASQPARRLVDDPRVNAMENKDVEELIRNKYASHSNHGKH